MDIHYNHGWLTEFDYHGGFSNGYEYLGNFKKSHQFKTIYQILNDEL